MSRIALLLAALLLALGSQSDAEFSFFGWFASAETEEPEAPAAEVHWIDEPAEALAAARRAGKPVLAYFTSTHCGYCRKMEKETWSDPAVAKMIASGFVPLRLHADDHPEEIAALGVRAFPTTVLISPQGKALAGRTGFLKPAALTELLRPAVASKKAAKPL